MKKLLPSNPEYRIYNELWNLYAIAKNPQVWCNEVDLEDYQKQIVIEKLKGWMEDLLDGLPAQFVEAIKENDDNVDSTSSDLV